jgi:hypothetical protein
VHSFTTSTLPKMSSEICKVGKSTATPSTNMCFDVFMCVHMVSKPFTPGKTFLAELTE